MKVKHGAVVCHIEKGHPFVFVGGHSLYGLQPWIIDKCAINDRQVLTGLLSYLSQPHKCTLICHAKNAVLAALTPFIPKLLNLFVFT